MSKRQFPYYSRIPEVEIKRRDLGSNAGQEIETNPNVYQAGQGFGDRREVPSPAVNGYLDRHKANLQSVVYPVGSSLKW
jgi:hypothetical protein